ncbi:MAG: hypothetical protein EOR16_23080 [Mesorhizobium sp.]|nr:MAG: hypothetical protein EOR16_23080 [Mesorhizobium sp.]
MALRERRPGSNRSARSVRHEDFRVLVNCGVRYLDIAERHQCEPSARDYVDAVPMLQAISTTDTTPMVRVPWNDPAIIGKVLDAGAYGVICPMVNTAEEDDAFFEACRYFPKGGRSVGPLCASLYAGADYFQHANDTIITMAMIESEQAVKNLEDILKTPNLDAIFVGPSDLAVTMGEAPGFDPRYPAV